VLELVDMIQKAALLVCKGLLRHSGKTSLQAVQMILFLMRLLEEATTLLHHFKSTFFPSKRSDTRKQNPNLLI